jgi:quinol monooxygenase YgiN
MFVLLVELEAKQGQFEELESLLRFLVASAESEPGTLFYAVHRPQGESHKFALYECYEDKAAWETHMKYEPVQNTLKRFESLLKIAPKIIFCDVVSTTTIATA